MNYCNPQISLSSVACYFNRSEVYISQFFKEQVGQNFSDYLENIRIQAACKCLIDPRLSIQEIAESTGYNSAHTFSRAFKKTMGISPSLYREVRYNDKVYSP